MENQEEITDPQPPPYQGPQRNFFALLAPAASQICRQMDVLAEGPAELFMQNNPPNVPAFVPNFVLSRFIHLINSTPGYHNQGRITLLLENKADYNGSKLMFFLQTLFNKTDCDSTVLLLQGHGSPDGALRLLLKEGDVLLHFQDIKNLWDKRTSKQSNRVLFILADFSYAGSWVLKNDAKDIVVHSSCSEKQEARDFIINKEIIGSVFLHNLLMLNRQANAFFENSEMTPYSTRIPPEERDFVIKLLGFDGLISGWDEFKSRMDPEIKIFNKDSVIKD